MLEFITFDRMFAVATFALGILVTRAYSARTGLRYHIEEVTIVGGDQPEVSKLKILFGSRQIPRLTRTSLVVWNSGNVSLEMDAFAPSAIPELRVAGPVLETNVTLRSDPSIRPRVSKISPEDGSVQLSFDLLKPKEGFAVEVLHEGLPKQTKFLATLKHSKHPPKAGYNSSLVHQLLDRKLTKAARAGMLIQNVLLNLSFFYILIMFAALAFAAGHSSASKVPAPAPMLPDQLIDAFPIQSASAFALYVGLVLFMHWRTYQQAPNPMSEVDSPSTNDIFG